MELQFKEGDAVTVNTRNFHSQVCAMNASSFRELGLLLTIARVDTGDTIYPYLVKDHKGETVWVRAEWLKARPRFGKGAKVVLDRSRSGYDYEDPECFDYGYELKDMVEPFTIAEVDESDDTYRVEDATGDWSWGEWDRFKSAPEEPVKSEKFIVCLTEAGRLCPSPSLFEYASREVAAREAERLSKQQTNRLFTVVKIERLSTVKTIAKTETETVVEVCK